MKVSWKKVSLFGLGLLVPALAFAVVQLTEREKSILQKRKAEIAGCSRCQKLFKIRAGNSFILHLQDQHGFTSDDSINVVVDLYKDWLKGT